MRKKSKELKMYEIYKNGTHQGNVFAYTKREASKIVFSTYGEERVIYKSN